MGVQDKDGDEGKTYFEKVSRLKCHSLSHKMDLEIDVNIDLCPLIIGDRFKLTLASTLESNGLSSQTFYNDLLINNKALVIKSFDYVMYGKIYKMRDKNVQKGHKCEVYASFGGLLMHLTGFSSDLESLELDCNIFLLMNFLN